MKTKKLKNGYIIREDGLVLNRHGKPISMQQSKEGYIRVEMWEGGKGKKQLLHRILADCFIPNPDNKPCINHINGIKHDNRLINLEWVTRSENQMHAYKMGLQKGYKKSQPISVAHKKALCGSRWKNEVHIYKLDGKVFNNLWDASEAFNVSRQTILNRCASEKYPKWTKSIERKVRNARET